MKHLLQFTLFLVLLTGASAWAACTAGCTACTAADLAVATLNTCIANAADGATITLPSGTVTWTGAGSSLVTVNKRVTIQGATTCTGKGQTLSCTDGTIINTSPSDVQGGVFYIEVSGARLTGLTINDTRASKSSNDNGLIATGYDTTDWRIDHLKLTINSAGSNATRAMSVWGYGLIDHVYFNSSCNGCVNPYGDSANDGSAIGGSYNWSQPMRLGSQYAIYIEDSYFKFTSGTLMNGAIDAYDGARYVARKNYFYQTNTANHGLDSTSWKRGGLLIETYSNTFANPGVQVYEMMDIRSGTGMYFNNTATGDFGVFLCQRSYRADIQYCAPYAWITYCDGTHTLDGNTGTAGYPCLDQVGRGTGGMWTFGNYPTSYCTKTGFAYLNQARYPLYIWNNTLNGSTPSLSYITAGSGGGCVTAAGANHIQSNRDFFAEGQGKMTKGTKANIPASCTQYQGYWVTDEGYWDATAFPSASGALYQCNASGVWVPYYVPYAYPHPLQSGLAAPTGVK